MLGIDRVHPRVRQRRRSVTLRRIEEVRANRQALIGALKRAINCLEGEPDALPRKQVGMTAALYRWALGELERSLRTEPVELWLIHAVCTLLDNASQDLLRAVSADHVVAAGDEKEIRDGTHSDGHR